MISLKKNIAVSESGFVFNPTTGDSFSLNGVGTDILKLMKDGKSEAEIKTMVRTSYDVDDDTFDKDYYDFLKMLGQYKLLDAE
ncbi:MAG: PqqD family peptide modification chaperone [Flavobacteriales bacterium]|nr:PqqD family peptide modification chaperone [Flavobacteriales bacterium]